MLRQCSRERAKHKQLVGRAAGTNRSSHLLACPRRAEGKSPQHHFPVFNAILAEEKNPKPLETNPETEKAGKSESLLQTARLLVKASWKKHGCGRELPHHHGASSTELFPFASFRDRWVNPTCGHCQTMPPRCPDTRHLHINVPLPRPLRHCTERP